MKAILRAEPILVLALALALTVPAGAQDKTKAPVTYPELPTEIPANFKPVTDSLDFTRREVMIDLSTDHMGGVRIPGRKV